MTLQGSEYLQSRAKRRLDLWGGLAIAGLTAPITVAAGVVAAIDTRTTRPMFRQVRIGKDGQELEVLKLRTLRKKRVVDTAVAYGAHDPRASKVGNFLRHFAIDEFPQAASIVKGDMSLVGIRPYLATDLERMEAADPELFAQWLSETRKTKPALFGVSQLGRRHYPVATTKEVDIYSMEADCAYMAAATLSLDLKILRITPLILLLDSPGMNQSEDEIIAAQ